MSQTIVQLGHVPVNRGNWYDDSGVHDSTLVYYKDNLVQFHGSTFIADPVDFSVTNPNATVTVPPYDDSVEGSTTLNPGWHYFVDAKTYVDEQLDIVVNGTPSDAINSMRAIISFLNQYTRDDSLYDILHSMQDKIDELDAQMNSYTLKEVNEGQMEALIANNQTDPNTLYFVSEDEEG